eukprot:symbB.v1.2.024363.t1/scaffold2300.1/size82923/2
MANFITFSTLLVLVQSGGLGDMADSYFASMSSPAGSSLCQNTKECCPGSQCVPGLEMMSGCDSKRGQTVCEAAESTSFFPVKNGICRCGQGFSCETGTCLEMKGPGHPTPMGTIPQVQRSLYDSQGRRADSLYNYRKAVAMNWVALSVSLLISFSLLLWLVRFSLHQWQRVDGMMPSSEFRHRPRPSEVQGLLVHREA